jgi:nicotinamidase-related amidase
MNYTFIEIDMRNDFANDPRAVLPTPGTYELVGKMHALEKEANFLVEVFDNHATDDPASINEFKTYPPHCIPGTWGHERIGGLPIPHINQLFRLPKNSYDTWQGMKGYHQSMSDLARLVSVIENSELILVGGVVTGICVKAFIDGIINHGFAFKTIVVSDCVANLENIQDIPSNEELFKRWTDAGVRVSTFSETINQYLI